MRRILPLFLEWRSSCSVWQRALASFRHIERRPSIRPMHYVTTKSRKGESVKTIASILSLVVLTITILAAQQPAQTITPVFEGKTTLLRPVNYREWIFVGSSRGLSYATNPPAQTQAPAGMGEMYHNVYISPTAYREFAKTGKFPEGTMLAMEMASADTKRELGL